MKKEDVPKSRRRFLKTAGYTAAGLAASPAMFRQTALAAGEPPILVGSLHDQSGPIAASGGTRKLT